LIIFDASTVVGAALKADSIPEQALLRAEDTDLFALSPAVDTEIARVLNRAKFARAVSRERRERILDVPRGEAIWFDPVVRVVECRDPTDDIYLELALAAGAEIMVSSDNDLLVLHPWRGVRILRPVDYLAL
jgi:putative PIN family toxin of toxin-antitoxin system